MTSHAPLPVPDEFARPRWKGETVAPSEGSSQERDAQAETLYGRLSRIADALRQAPGGASQPAAIDRLLYAIGEHNGFVRENAKGQAGTITVAIDSIIRWIGDAESRFTTLAETGIRDQRRMARIATLAEAQGQAMHKQAVTVRNMLGKAEKAISSLERKLDHIECRITENRPDRLNQQIATLTRNLDRHYRLTTRNADSSARYFELMTRQIENFAWELRQLRVDAGEAKRKTALLPQLVETLDRLAEEKKTAAEPQAAVDGGQSGQTLAAINQKLDQAIGQFESETDTARNARQAVQTDMETLRQRIRQLEELSRSLIAGKTAASDAAPAADDRGAPASLHLRGSFIAAARQAMRTEQSPQQEDGVTQAGGSRFLRTAGIGGA